MEPDFSSELDSLNLSFAFDPLKGKLCSMKKDGYFQVRSPVLPTEKLTETLTQIRVLQSTFHDD